MANIHGLLTLLLTAFLLHTTSGAPHTPITSSSRSIHPAPSPSINQTPGIQPRQNIATPCGLTKHACYSGPTNHYCCNLDQTCSLQGICLPATSECPGN